MAGVIRGVERLKNAIYAARSADAELAGAQEVLKAAIDAESEARQELYAARRELERALVEEEPA